MLDYGPGPCEHCGHYRGEHLWTAKNGWTLCKVETVYGMEPPLRGCQCPGFSRDPLDEETKVMLEFLAERKQSEVREVNNT